MPQPYTGEIRVFAGDFAPAGWRLCNGDLLDIGDNGQLFEVIGTTYGGDGTSTFALPDLRGRVPIHSGDGFALAAAGGVETVTLSLAQLPAHTHALQATQSIGTDVNPQGEVLAGSAGALKPYVEDVVSASLSALAVRGTGTGQAHSNLQPYLGVHFIIALYGSVPSPA